MHVIFFFFFAGQSILRLAGNAYHYGHMEDMCCPGDSAYEDKFSKTTYFIHDEQMRIISMCCGIGLSGSLEEQA